MVTGGPNAAPILLTTATNVAIPPMTVMATIAPPLMNMLTLQFPTPTGGDEDDCHEEGKEGSAAVLVISPSPATGTGVPPPLNSGMSSIHPFEELYLPPVTLEKSVSPGTFAGEN